MLVRDLMTTDPVTISAESNLRDAMRLMLSEAVDYVIVVDSDGNPGGFVTKDDVVGAVYQAEPPPAEIRIVAVAHTPDFTVGPEMTVRKAGRRLTEENAAVAPVMDGLELVGVLTLPDIVEHLSLLLQQAAASEQAERKGLDL